MTEELQKLLNAVKKFKLQNGRYEYLKARYNELFEMRDKIDKEIDEVGGEMQNIQYKNDAFDVLVSAALAYPFEDLHND